MAALRIADLVGRVLGDRYRLTRPLGTGASAHVYVADDVILRRRVAIKVLHPGLADDEAFLRRFRAEARAVAALRHPHILRVYDWGEDDGSPYLVTELLEGGSLRGLLDRGHLLTASQATAIGFDAAGALDYAHRRGLVHRDIKPANLLFDEEGRVSIADFGLARALAESTVTEPAGAIVGTARYAAPEQVRGRTLDARADVYSLALVLVEATTGVVPFAADTMIATLMARLDAPLRVPDGAGPLAAAIEAAGTIDPADRLDAAGLARALAALAPTLPPPAPLPLAGPLTTGEVERDVNPTQLRGAPAGTRRPRPAPEPEAVLLDRGRPDLEPGGGGGGDGHGDGDTAPPPEDGDDTWAGQAQPDDGVDLDDSVDLDGAGAALPAEGEAWADDVGVWVDDDVWVGEDEAWADVEPDARGREAWVADEAPRARRARFAVDAPSGASRRAWGRVLLGLVLVVLVVVGVTAWVLSHRSPTLETVPSLRGETEAQATATLAQSHLVLTIVGRAYDPQAPVGTVTGQSPPDGRVHEHSSVAVTVSLGPQPVLVPQHLAGLTQAGAAARIRGAGLKLGPVTSKTSITVARGHVIAASPSSGTLLPGQAVALEVSSGKPHVTVPPLAGAATASYTAAAAALSQAHLIPSRTLQYSNTVAAGSVIGTDPGAGQSVLYGTGVVVVVSQGPHLVTVPGVAGDTVAQADSTLSAAGLAVTGVTGNPSGRVTGTSPAQGRTVLFGSSIQILTK